MSSFSTNLLAFNARQTQLAEDLVSQQNSRHGRPHPECYLLYCISHVNLLLEECDEFQFNFDISTTLH